MEISGIITGVVTRFRNYKKSIMNVGYYFMASFIPMLINLFLSPVYALNLSAEDFAIVGYFTSFTSLLSPLILFELNQYYMREYFFKDDDGRKHLRATVFQAFLVYPFIIMGLSLLGIYIYMRVFNTGTEMPFSPYAFLSLLPLALAGIYRLELIDCKVQRRGNDYFKINITNSFLLILFTIVFVVILKWGAKGKLLGAMLPALIMFIWSFSRHWDILKEKFDWSLFKQSFVFCAPLVIAAMLGFFTGGYDKVLLEKNVTLYQLGIYSVGLSIASYLNVFSNAIGETFNPDIYESIARNNKRRAIKYILIQVGIMAAIVIVFVLLAKYAIIILTANRYVESTPFARIASIAAVTGLAYGAVTPFILSAKKTKVILYAKALGSFASVVTYLYLITNYGVYGAAWGFVICPLYNAFFALILYTITNRIKK